MGRRYAICRGWDIQDMGEEAYLRRVTADGPIHCEIHNCNAWFCFSAKPEPISGARVDDRTRDNTTKDGE